MRFHHIALNRALIRVDITSKMSIQHNTTYDKTTENAAKFAHELANLLDGSMRNVALARSLMNDKSGAADAAAETDLLARLQTAEQGMKQMATLLKRWLADNHHPAQLSTTGMTLGDALSQARQLHAPAASAMGIEINLHITSEAAMLAAGPVFSVVANALRNSIEAIAADPKRGNGPGVIDVRAQLQGGHVRINIADNGPGLARELFDMAGIFRFNGTTKPDGHGLGLALSRDIATSLGGNLRVTNRDEGGAQVALSYPAQARVGTKSQ